MRDDTLYLGATKLNITPKKPVQLVGFASRSQADFIAKDSDIYARFFYFNHQNGADAEQQALVISVDLLCWGNEFATRLRDRISKRWGIPQSAVVLHATHNHSGPTTRKFVNMKDPDSDYIEFLQRQIMDGIDLAIANAEPVRIERGVGESAMAVNRRKAVNGNIVNASNDKGPTDPELTVIKFLSDSGATKAVWVHYTCHPVLTSANRLSSEYCGIAVELLEQQLGGEAIVGFLQGCCGDINPSRGGAAHGYDVICELGRQLAEDVQKTLEDAMVPLKNAQLRCVRHTAKLPYRNIPTLGELQNKQRLGTGLEKGWAAFLIQHPEEVETSATLELTKIDFADNLSLLFMNGEMVVSYGLFVKECSNGSTIPVAYTNGIIGYVTTAKQLEEGGYEPIDSVFYYGLPSPYDSQVESIVLNKIKETIRTH